MCGRFQLAVPLDELVEVFDVDVPTFDDWPLRWNLAPTQDAPAILRGREGERRIGLLRWGLVPSWARDASIGGRMINARSETVASKPAFRDAFAARRCLIPMTGFYEWRRDDEGTKTPFLIRRPDRRPFAVAGLWERWRDGDGHALATFTLLTTAASSWMSRVHDRMPVLLEAERARRWLAPDAPAAALQELLKPASDDAFEAVEVSTAVNRPANDRAEVAEAMPGGELLPQGIPGSTETR